MGMKIMSRNLECMIERINHRNIFLRGICSILSLLITTIGGAVTLEKIKEIKEITGGKGVFALAITNEGDHGLHLNVSLYMTKAPPGCEELEEDGYGISVSIKAHETLMVELPVPFISPHGWNDMEQYDNIDNRLPLAEDSRVEVSITNVQDRCCSRRRGFGVDYLEGTRLIKMPAKVSLKIDCDPKKPYDQWLRDLFIAPRHSKKINQIGDGE